MADAPATRTMQGIVVPAASVQPAAFFELTRRERIVVGQRSLDAWGGTENIPMLQTGILGGLTIRVVGELTTDKGSTGTVASSARWPYDLLRAVRFSANGQNNLINAGGWPLKMREFTARGDQTDRGVAKGIGGASPGTSRTQGTLSLATESWGVGQNVTAIADNTYAFDFSVEVPIAFDKVNLLGAVFAQTSSTDLNLAIDIATHNELFTLTGDASQVAIDADIIVEATLYSIPMGPNGDVIVPDLSAFHSVIQTRQSGLASGDNEVRLAGQGVGRQLMRLWWRTWAGATPAPLPVNDTNYGRVGWRYGGNTTPEVWQSGAALAQANERLFGSDFATYQGFGIFDWSSEHAFRDTIDEGAATELRLLLNLAGTPTSPAVEYIQETVFAASIGA